MNNNQQKMNAYSFHDDVMNAIWESMTYGLDRRFVRVSIYLTFEDGREMTVEAGQQVLRAVSRSQEYLL